MMPTFTHNEWEITHRADAGKDLFIARHPDGSRHQSATLTALLNCLDSENVVRTTFKRFEAFYFASYGSYAFSKNVVTVTSISADKKFRITMPDGKRLTARSLEVFEKTPENEAKIDEIVRLTSEIDSLYEARWNAKEALTHVKV